MKLADLTTLRVGGEAARLIAPNEPAQLIERVLELWSTGEEWLALGGGSNLLVSDDGFDGTVVRVVTRGIERIDDGGTGPVVIRVQAGEPWDEVVAYAVANGWMGIESLSGIPGSSGAAPIQNIGAYGQELASVLVAIEFLDYQSGELTRIVGADLGLGYRTSAIKRGRQGLVVSIELQLDPTPSAGLGAPVAYAGLATALGVKLGDRAPLPAVRSAVLALRASKGMLLDPADPDSVSAGSFFTNPIVSENFARGLPTDMPRWPTARDEPDAVVSLGEDIPTRALGRQYTVKLSAAWLIEHAGVSRGFALPGSRAAISSKHTLAIVNRGGATAEEIAQLARYVQTRVYSEFGVRLVPEPVFVGVTL